MPTIFEQIIAGTIPAEKVYEDDKVIVIKDIAPSAPVHLLIITKKVIPCLQEMEAEDYPLMGHIAEVAQRMAKEFGVEEAYRFIINNGREAGQTVYHLHAHLIGGRTLRGMA